MGFFDDIGHGIASVGSDIGSGVGHLVHGQIGAAAGDAVHGVEDATKTVIVPAGHAFLDATAPVAGVLFGGIGQRAWVGVWGGALDAAGNAVDAAGNFLAPRSEVKAVLHDSLHSKVAAQRKGAVSAVASFGIGSALFWALKAVL